MNVARRQLLAAGVGATLLGPSLAARPPSRRQDDDWQLVEADDIGVEGLGWKDTEGPYQRLPARAKETVREPVWRLSQDTSGVHVSFETDARSLRFEVEVTREQLAMAHMPASGVSGVDLYARDDAGTWRWVVASRPGRATYEVTLGGLSGDERAYRLYFPLYNGVKSLRIGVPKGASFTGTKPRTSKPLVYYGTSIAQGACASRPGMAFVNVLGRRLDRPVINLGFSGNGRMELALAELLGELDAAAFVVDCLPNLGPDQVKERAQPFVRRLRELRPDAPIVLVEDRVNANASFLAARARHHDGNHARLAEAYRALTDGEVPGLLHVPDAPFLGDDGEATVDGSHPTDLGMMRYADALEAPLRAALDRDAGKR